MEMEFNCDRLCLLTAFIRIHSFHHQHHPPERGISSITNTANNGFRNGNRIIEILILRGRIRKARASLAF